MPTLSGRAGRNLSPFVKTAMYLAAFVAAVSPAFATPLPIPASQETFMYVSVDAPVLSGVPGAAKPIGLGPVASGGDTLNVHVRLTSSESLDLYLLLYAPFLDPDHFYFLRKDGTLQRHSEGLAAWKTSVTGINEKPFGEIPISTIPEGTYFFYLVATPTGATEHYYVWETRVSVKSARITLPEDDAVHEEPVEWWYWTGHFQDALGYWYGFEEVFFLLRFGDLEYVVAHHSITDVHAGNFSFDVHLGEGNAAVLSNGFSLVSGSWTASGGGGSDHLHGEVDDYVLDMHLISEKPPVFHFGDGYTDFDFGSFTYYYSRERMALQGTLRISGETRSINGTAWFDHQWGDFIAALEIGWDWFGIQLDEGKEFMLFIIRDSDGTPIRGGTIANVDGHTEELHENAFSVTTLADWTSPTTGCTYPSGWEISVDGLSLTLIPVLEEQEISYPIPYWEGASTVEGDATGRAYVELTGYCS